MECCAVLSMPNLGNVHAAPTEPVVVLRVIASSRQAEATRHTHLTLRSRSASFERGVTTCAVSAYEMAADTMSAMTAFNS